MIRLILSRSRLSLPVTFSWTQVVSLYVLSPLMKQKPAIRNEKCTRKKLWRKQKNPVYNWSIIGRQNHGKLPSLKEKFQEHFFIEAKLCIFTCNSVKIIDRFQNKTVTCSFVESLEYLNNSMPKISGNNEQKNKEPFLNPDRRQAKCMCPTLIDPKPMYSNDLISFSYSNRHCVIESTVNLALYSNCLILWYCLWIEKTIGRLGNI